MKVCRRLHPVALALVCAIPLPLSIAVLPATVEAQTSSVASPLPPEVLRAIDDVYQADKQAGNTAARMAAGRSGSDDGGWFAFGSEGSTPVAAFNGRLLAVGVGAIAGLVVFNLAGSGVAAVPMLAYVSGGVNVLESSAAIGRVYAVTGVVVGSLAGDYLFRKRFAPTLPIIPATEP
jgi:hypothetical protein